MDSNERAAVTRGRLRRLTETLLPGVLALIAFLNGATLLISGALPPSAARLAVLARFFPIGLIDASHFIGSIVGAGLLVLSHGLSRRLDAAFAFTLGAVTLGIVTSLLKASYEVAAALTLFLLVLRQARPAFNRRAAFFDTRFSAGWIAAVVAVVSTSVW